MKKQHIILSCLLVLICGTATAQFKKALPNMRVGQASDAKVNVGIFGGGNFTMWQHLNSAQTADWYVASYRPTFRIGYFGGIAVEYMLNSNMSVGLNALYEQHSIGLSFQNDNFPTGLNQHMKRKHDFTADYQSIEAYVPFTYYINIGSKHLKPYFFAAPRVSYILDGFMSYTRTDMDLEDNVIYSQTESTLVSDSTYRLLNVGGMVGVGTQVRVNTNNYYFLFKFDISANVNGLHTFTDIDLLNEFNYRRFAADAHATLTIMLPIKKRGVGACVRWGEYD